MRMKFKVGVFAFILVASIMIMEAPANARTFYACGNGVIKLGDTMKTVKRKCHVIDKERVVGSATQYWTVTGKFKDDGVLSIRRGRVVRID